MFCSKCGKEIEDDAKFCKYCGAKIGDEPKKEQTREEIATELNKYRYCPNCKKDTDKNNPVCQHCGFDINNNASKQPSLGESIFGLIAIIVIVLMIRGCNGSDTPTQPKYTPEQKEEMMQKTNKLMLDAQNGGLVTKINKECTTDGEFCTYYIRVNENMWSMFSFEDKENFNRFVQEYAELRSNEAAAEVQGHYSGKVLATKFKGVVRQ